MIDTKQAPFNKSRIDKFTLVLNLPPALKSINDKFNANNRTINLDALQFSVFGVVVPEITVPAVETRFSGSTMYVSSHNRTSFPASSVNFNIDNQFANYWVIYQWLNVMRDEKEGSAGEILNARNLAQAGAVLAEYSSIFTLYAKDEFNNNIIKFDYYNAFPTRLGSINWNYQDSKEIQSSFEFVFSNITCTLV